MKTQRTMNTQQRETWNLKRKVFCSRLSAMPTLHPTRHTHHFNRHTHLSQMMEEGIRPTTWRMNSTEHDVLKTLLFKQGQQVIGNVIPRPDVYLPIDF